MTTPRYRLYEGPWELSRAPMSIGRYAVSGGDDVMICEPGRVFRIDQLRLLVDHANLGMGQRTGIWWQPPGYEGDVHRCMLGKVWAGSVFPTRGGRYHRWRVWVTKNRTPSEGSDSSIENCKLEVETRIHAFLDAAGVTA